MLSLAALMVLVFLSGSSRPAGTEPVTLLRVPTGGIQPQIAVDSGGVVHVAYFKGDPAHGDIFYTRVAGDGGFAPAIKVNSEAGSAIATGTVRGPHIALGRSGRVHIAWMGSSLTHAPDAPAPVLYARLADGGHGFEPQRNLTRAALIGPDGGSIAADPSGRVYVAWHALVGGGKGEGDRRLLVVRSQDDGKTFGAERTASDPAAGACGCCGTAAITDKNGAVYALYRGARDGAHRDTFLTRSTDNGETFAAIDLHPWDQNACPMSTYALANDPEGGSIAAAWETGGQVYWTRIDPRTGKASGVFTAGATERNQRHPAVAMNRNGQTLLVWTEGTSWNRGGTLAWQTFDRNGSAVGERGHAPGVPAWGLAAVYPRRDGTFVIVY